MNKIWVSRKITRCSEDNIIIGKQATWDNGDKEDHATWDNS
jgi:hypothetical protein